MPVHQNNYIPSTIETHSAQVCQNIVAPLLVTINYPLIKALYPTLRCNYFKTRTSTILKNSYPSLLSTHKIVLSQKKKKRKGKIYLTVAIIKFDE